MQQKLEARQLIWKPLHTSYFIRQLKISSDDVKMANLLLVVDYFLDFSLNNFIRSVLTCGHFQKASIYPPTVTINVNNWKDSVAECF